MSSTLLFLDLADTFALSVLLVGIFCFYCLFYGILFVSTGEEVLIERLGKYNRKLGPGFHLVLPLVENTKYVNWCRNIENNVKRIQEERLNSFRIPTIEMVYDFPCVDVITSDRLQVKVNGILFYRIQDVEKAVYGINNLWKSVEELVKVSIFNTAASMDHDKIMNSRPLLQNNLYHDFKEPSARWGITVTQLEIQGILPSKDIVLVNEKIVKEKREVDSLIAKINAEGDAQLQKSKLEQQTKDIQAETLKKQEATAAESRYFSVVKEAESRSTSIRLDAEANRDRRLLEIESEVVFVRKMLEAGVSEDFLMKHKYAEAWKALSHSQNQSQLIIPYEASTFLGSLNAAKFALRLGSIDTLASGSGNSAGAGDVQ